jgi:hypothetical protein
MTLSYRPSPVRSFERHLRAENRSEHTIASYLESFRQVERPTAGAAVGGISCLTWLPLRVSDGRPSWMMQRYSPSAGRERKICLVQALGGRVRQVRIDRVVERAYAAPVEVEARLACKRWTRGPATR